MGHVKKQIALSSLHNIRLLPIVIEVMHQKFQKYHSRIAS